MLLPVIFSNSNSAVCCDSSTKSVKLGPIINSNKPIGIGNHIQNISARMKIQNKYTDTRYDIESKDNLALSHDRPSSYGVLRIGGWTVVEILETKTVEYLVEFLIDCGVFVVAVVPTVSPSSVVLTVSSGPSVPSFPSFPSFSPVSSFLPVSSFPPDPLLPPFPLLPSVSLSSPFLPFSSKGHMSNCPFERNIPAPVY